MNTDDSDNWTPGQLARLLDVGEGEGAAAWGGEDGASALRHQLAAGLLPDLAAVPGAEAGRLEALVARQAERTFLGQLTTKRPAVELLEAIKRFARHVRDEGGSPLSGGRGEPGSRGGPATVLYFAAIAAAELRCGERITQLSAEEVRAGCRWALEQPGAEELAGLFGELLGTA